MRTTHDSTPKEVPVPAEGQWAWTDLTTQGWASTSNTTVSPETANAMTEDFYSRKSKAENEIKYRTVTDEEYDMEWRLSERAKKNIIGFIVGAAIAFLIYYLTT